MSLIDVLGVKQLTNAKPEWTEYGSLSVAQLEALAAPPLQVSRHYALVLLFNVKKSVDRGLPIDDATRMMWQMSANSSFREHSPLASLMASRTASPQHEEHPLSSGGHAERLSI